MQRQYISVTSPPGSNPAKFRFKLAKKLYNVVNVCLIHAVIPNSAFTIEANDDCFYFNDVKIVLPDGYYYTINDIVGCVQSAIRSTTLSETSVTIDSSTSKVTFSDVAPFVLRFKAKSKLNTLMGFPKVTTSNEAHVAVGVAPATIMFFKSNLYKIRVKQCHSVLSGKGVIDILCKNHADTITYYANCNQFGRDRTFGSERQFDRLDIEITDEYDVPIQFNGVAVSLVFEITQCKPHI